MLTWREDVKAHALHEAGGIVVPEAGMAMTGAGTPMLALLMLCVSMTFDWPAVLAVLRRPVMQALATALVYRPMSLAGAALGRAGFGTSAFGAGMTLVGVLPVSKREFSIAAVVVFSSGLPAEVALPAAVYAVVQMLTSPLVARALARRANHAPASPRQ